MEAQQKKHASVSRQCFVCMHSVDISNTAFKSEENILPFIIEGHVYPQDFSVNVEISLFLILKHHWLHVHNHIEKVKLSLFLTYGRVDVD
jgi:hypothetical protein